MRKLSYRRLGELLALVFIIVCALSVFWSVRSKQTTLTLDDGQIIYTGYVVNDRMNGKGTLAYANGDTYEGEFKNGTFHGKGTFTSNSGWSYTGEFKNGQADGQGTLKSETGVYEGRFKQGILQK